MTLSKRHESVTSEQRLPEEFFESNKVLHSVPSTLFLGIVEFGVLMYRDGRSTSITMGKILSEVDVQMNPSSGNDRWKDHYYRQSLLVPTVRHECTHLFVAKEKGLLAMGKAVGKAANDGILMISPVLSRGKGGSADTYVEQIKIPKRILRYR